LPFLNLPVQILEQRPRLHKVTIMVCRANARVAARTIDLRPINPRPESESAKSA
jgi:hypothetical protein